MAHKHEPEDAAALDTLIARLGELEVVLGAHVGPDLDVIRSTLLAASAARSRGDVPAAIDHIGQAMDRLTGLAERLDPAEAILMRALAHSFRTALLRGDDDQVKHTTATMLQKSGAVERKKPG